MWQAVATAPAQTVSLTQVRQAVITQVAARLVNSTENCARLAFDASKLNGVAPG